ncbi:MAG: hypothetical protein HYV27_04470 [Candidatus Hydrogenedentes bacterium]|nr:hypothetical protein [Candidatus Hydrogenedentota bacterium]
MTREPESSPLHRYGLALGVFLCLTLLSLITVFNQVKSLGLSWQEAHYTQRLEAVLQGTAPAPGAYRILSDGATVLLYRAAAWCGLPRATGLTFIAIRLAQNLAIFAMCVLYYRRLGIPVYLSLLGVSGLAWGMTHSNFNSDLSINIYTELILYLIAAYALLAGRLTWIVPITVIGALNRETSLFIPVLLLAAYVETRPVLQMPARIFAAGLAALAVFLLIQGGLHLLLDSSGLPPHSSGEARGLPLLWHNLSSAQVWSGVFGVMGVFPVLALAGWRHWPHPLRAFAITLVPGWMLLHFAFAAAGESRFFLVPQALVFVPAALWVLLAWRELLERRGATSVWT